MRKLVTLTLIYVGLLSASVNAQIVDGLDTLYGHEWINSDQSYARLEVEETGFYRIDYEQLLALGWPVATINSNNFQLYHFGDPVYYFASNGGQSPLAAGDYLLFYAEKNRGELDQYLFRDAANQQLNPHYSLYSDKSTYFLSWSASNGATYTTVTNDTTNPPAAAAYVWREASQVFTEDFMKEYQRFSGVTLYFSHFGIGEGYGSRSINELLSDGETVQELTIDLPAAYAGGPAAELETRYTAALFEHIQQLSANGISLRIDTFNNWRMVNASHTLPSEVLTSGTAQLRWEGFGGEKDEVSVGFAKIRYPAIPDADEENFYAFELEGNGQAQYLEISNVNTSEAVVYDLTNGWRIPVENIAAGELRVLLPAAEGLRQLIVVAEDAISPVGELNQANLNLPETAGADYIILTHSLLRADGDPVQDYADYRTSLQGGGYSTAVVNIDDLFDQFGYGVPQHPLAIRNFVIWQRKLNPNFKFLFIVGKGREYINLRSPAELEEALGTTLFVPSFGYPASDNLLVSKLDKPTPEVCVGRLPAVSSAEVTLYLNKIRGLEGEVANAPQTIAGKSWTKNILHLGGGTTPSERQSIKNHLSSMKQSIEDGVFGGQVTSYYKGSTDPIETSQSDLIFDRINNGVSLLTFFGHSSAGTFDFSIDNENNYLNVNKYPMMMSLGCYSGNMFDSFRSIGERFIFLENGGAGVYAASRGVGFIHALGAFGQYFHDQMSSEYYGLSVGEGLQQSIRNFEDFTDLAYGALNEQFSLQGDPAFRLSTAAGPDFTFEAGSAKTTPAIVNAQKDSFSLSVQLYNLGRRHTDSVSVLVWRVLPNGVEEPPLLLRIPSPAYADELTFQLPTRGRDGVGINTLRLRVNPMGLEDAIPETPLMASQNNDYLNNSGQIGMQFFIIDNAALPVWPPTYALVGAQEPVLKASTADPLAATKKYQFQIDTSIDFNSLLASETIVQKGGVLEWTPTLNWQDSTVYFWRVSPDSSEVETNEFIWEHSSFTYLANQVSGWGQGQWGQWKDGGFENKFLKEDKSFGFTSEFVNIRIKNKMWEENDRPGLIYNNEGLAGSVRPWNYLEAGMAAVVYEQDDPNGFWRNPPPGVSWAAGEYGVPTGGNRVFAFPTATVEDRANFMTFLNEEVPAEAYVFIFSIIKTSTAEISSQEWAMDSTAIGANIFQVLEAQGANEIRNLAELGTVPYILMYRKGLGVIGEAISLDRLDPVNVEFNLSLTKTSGKYTTPVFGPGTDWASFRWNFDNIAQSATNVMNLYGGILPSDLQLILQDTVQGQGEWTIESTPATDSIRYLQLVWESIDEENRTPSPIDYIHLSGRFLPDLAINSNVNYVHSGDTLTEGATYEMTVAITNISDQDITDSIQVIYSWIGQNGFASNGTQQLPPLASEQSTDLNLSTETFGAANALQLLVDVNSSNMPAEITRVNNVLSKEIYLKGDGIDPVVNVAFDGRKILNGDLVSGAPLINIEITDENRYLALDDPTLFEVMIVKPNGESTLVANEMIDFSYEFTENINKAKLQWVERFEEDGMYRLQISAKDVSGNTAGRLLHELDFEIINKVQLSNFLPYPNPFTTNTRFVYTLTGNTPLNGVSIQIMTVSGRIVRQISSAELGPLSVGVHQTEFSWDGRDDYGDQLANGVYLYRLVLPTALTERNDEFQYENTKVDYYFKNGIGKIVILR